jgi:hypothetical protein
LPFQQARAIKRTAGAILTEAEVRVIKRELARSVPARTLSQIYMVGLETIRRIARGDTWAWVGEEPETDINASLPDLPPEHEARMKAAQQELLRLHRLEQVPQRAGLERLEREIEKAKEPERLLEELKGGEDGRPKEK